MNAWRLLEVDPKGEEWHNLLSNVPHLTFHEPLWATVTEEGFSSSENCCLILQHDGQAVGGMLGFIVRVLWAKLLYINIPYGGIIGQSPPSEDLAEILKEFCRAKGVARVSINTFPNQSDPPKTGFQITPMSTAMLDLREKTEAEISKGFKGACRRNIKKALRADVSIEEANSLEGAETFYNLYLASMRRNQALAKYSSQWIEAIVKRITMEEKGTLLLARREGEAIAGILIVDSPIGSHYLMGGSKTEALRYCPNDLLFNTAIMRAARKGMDFFDFLPSGPDDVALERFKLKWGSTSHTADVCTLVVRPLVMASWNLAYRLAATRPVRALLSWRRSRSKENR